MYVECSSKEMKGVDDVFELAVNTAVGREHEIKRWESNQGASRVASGGAGAKKIKKTRCRIL